MTITPVQVLLYIPNIVGYARVVCAVSSFCIMICFPDTLLWILGVSLYLANFVGDLVDGWAARKFQQCSSFGSVLDMVTDRCGTAGFLYVLGSDFASVDATMTVPWYRMLFLGLLLLDISSHWVQMHSSLALGLHHKSAEGNKRKNFLVRWFYEYYAFFAYLCVGAEFTYIFLYIRLKLGEDDSAFWGYAEMARRLVSGLLLLCIPGCFAKQLVNIAQLGSSCYAIAAHDAENGNKTE